MRRAQGLVGWAQGWRGRIKANASGASGACAVPAMTAREECAEGAQAARAAAARLPLPAVRGAASELPSKRPAWPWGGARGVKWGPTESHGVSSGVPLRAARGGRRPVYGGGWNDPVVLLLVHLGP